MVGISRSQDADLIAGTGLDGALRRAQAVIDVSNVPAASDDESVALFGRATRHLLDAEAGAGVRHHVLLSILGVDRVEGDARDAGKREQERLAVSRLVRQRSTTLREAAARHRRAGVPTVSAGRGSTRRPRR